MLHAYAEFRMQGVFCPTLLLRQLFRQFEEAASEYEGVECWSARDLQVLLLF